MPNANANGSSHPEYRQRSFATHGTATVGLTAAPVRLVTWQASRPRLEGVNGQQRAGPKLARSCNHSTVTIAYPVADQSGIDKVANSPKGMLGWTG